MNSSDEKIYTFGPFTLNAPERLLTHRGTALTLAPKVFDTLLLLVQNPGRVISKEKMMASIWHDSFVEENNLAQNISVLRRLLDEGANGRFIETVPKLGYRFVAEVQEGEPKVPDAETFETSRARIYISEDGEPVGSIVTTAPTMAELAPQRPETHYVQNGDVNIAYQVVGEGDVDIVFVMGWISHLEYFWKHHLFASFLERLASFSRLILFDKRGTGLSDRVPINELPTLEQRMEDVHAVMNAVGSERAVLFGVSEGGPMCSLFAATYPERTAAVIMFGTYAKRIKDEDYPWAPTVDQRNKFIEMIGRDWGKPVGIEERAPSMANDPEFRSFWAEYLRMGASPGAAVALTKMNAEIDVRNVLPLVRVPTLVLHRSGDQCLKVEEGRYVASRIPGSRYVEFSGNDHLPIVGNQDEILDEVEKFVTTTMATTVHDRVLATVINIQINRNGASNEDFDAALSSIRSQLELFRGSEVSSDEHTVVAAFDGPARAIRCTAAIVKAGSRYDIKLRGGIHTGECDRVGESYSGFAVDLAERIANTAATDSILVSRTVKDLVAGSGIEFEELGVETFDGLDGEWRLFVVS